MHKGRSLVRGRMFRCIPIHPTCRFCHARGREARLDILLPCPPRRFADRHRRTRRQSAHLEHKAHPKPRIRVVWEAAEVAQYSHYAHGTGVRGTMGPFRAVVSEWERRRDCYDMGFGPVSAVGYAG